MRGRISYGAVRAWAGARRASVFSITHFTNESVLIMICSLHEPKQYLVCMIDKFNQFATIVFVILLFKISVLDCCDFQVVLLFYNG